MCLGNNICLTQETLLWMFPVPQEKKQTKKPQCKMFPIPLRTSVCFLMDQKPDRITGQLLLFNHESWVFFAVRLTCSSFAHCTWSLARMMPIFSCVWAPHRRTSLLLHMGINYGKGMKFTSVSQECGKDFPFPDCEPPENKVSEVPVLQFPCDYHTSNWWLSHSWNPPTKPNSSRSLNLLHERWRTDGPLVSLMDLKTYRCMRGKWGIKKQINNCFTHQSVN